MAKDESERFKGRGVLQITGRQGPHPGFVAAASYATWGNNTGANNIAIGYKAGYVVGAGLAQTQPINSITFNNQGKAVLIITKDGDVEWHGKPSEAADALQTVFQFKVEDMKGITKAARRRYYHKACENILSKAERMEHDEFLDFLRKHVYNKERRIIVDALQGNT